MRVKALLRSLLSSEPRPTVRILPSVDDCSTGRTDDDLLVLPPTQTLVQPADPLVWFDAISQGNKTLVQALLEAGRVDVDASFLDQKLDLIISAIHLAAIYGHVTVLKLLLQAGCSVDRPAVQASDKMHWVGATPLHLGVMMGSFWTVHHLIHAGCDIHATFRTILKVGDVNHVIQLDAVFLAAEKGYWDIMDELLRHGGNPNTLSRYYHDGSLDTSALHMAVQGKTQGHKKAINLLLRHGADVNVTDNTQCCPLVFAVQNNDALTVHLLLKHNANPDARMYVNKVGYLTALQVAALRGYDLIVSLLCAARAALNEIVPTTGRTALHLAAFAGNTDIVRLLVQKGASTNVLDFESRSPLVDARDGNQHDVVQILEEEQRKGFLKYGMYFCQGRQTTAGACLIVNNKDFVPEDVADRPESVKDVELLSAAFTHLGYKVLVRENLTSTQLVDTIQTMKQSEIHDHHESFVCCLMSHGDHGSVLGVDGNPVMIASLTQRLKKRLCPTMAGKLKMIIVQTCQGRLEDIQIWGHTGESSQPHQEARPGDSTSAIPHTETIPEEDFLIWTASRPGYAAYRENRGSPFLQALGKRLLSITTTKVELMEVIKDVNRTMAEYRPNRGQGDRPVEYKQTPCLHTTVTVDTYLYQRERIPTE